MAYLGIDLGTTNSVAVIFDDKNEDINVVKIEGIDEVLPSVVCINEDEVIVGDEAKNGAIIYPENTISSIKRKMGDSEGVLIDGKEYLPEEISSLILKKIKENATLQSGENFDEVVITHPAYFNDSQIYATKRAGELAGFKSVHLLSEPLAAAIEYGYKQGYAQTILVYDLGGGTFDACVLKVSKDIYGNESFEELSDVGDMNLGGDDFDNVLIDYMVKKFEMIANVSLVDLESQDEKRILQRFKEEAEIIKIKLSSTNKAVCKINPLVIIDGIPINFQLEVTKDDFESLIKSYIERTKEITFNAIERADLRVEDITKVILVGGSTLIPMVKRVIAGTIKEPYRATDPAKSVAMGAAIYNYLIHLPNSKVAVSQITRKVFGTKAIVNATTNEEELIPIIDMGESIPVKKTDENFTVTKRASAVNVDVYQWEEEAKADKKYIGSLTLEGIKEDSKISLTYSINEDNIFEVFVKDLNTNNEIVSTFDRNKSMPMIEREVTIDSVSGMNIVFIIDTTTSMDRFIDGVKDRAIAFSNILHDRDIDYQLGLIGFGDLLERERPKVYRFTDDILKFQKRVRKIPRTCGGDIPESSLDALETGLKLLNKSKLDKTRKNIFILITDAPPHIPTVSGKDVSTICNELDEENITTYVVARKDKESVAAYEPLTKKDGKYYNIDEPFFDIIDNIAVSIAQLVRL